MLIEAMTLAAVLYLLSKKREQESGPCGVFTRPGVYFSWEELTTHRDTPNLANKPSTPQCQNLKRLVTDVLDPLRELSGAAIYVNSAFRSAQVNAATPGSAHNSLHLQGKAADIYSNLLNPQKLKELIEAHPALRAKIRGLIVYPSHLHITIP